MQEYTVVFDGEENMESAVIFAPSLTDAYQQADDMGLVVGYIYPSEDYQ